jgi:DNA polymerase
MLDLGHRLGERLPAGTSYSTVIASFDFETYSEAGMKCDPQTGKWTSQVKKKTGIGVVGAWKYSRHPSTEILNLSYDLKDGIGIRLWVPGMSLPQDLFDYVGAGGLIEAWNSFFEYSIWRNVCYERMRWDWLPLEQLRDAMAKSRAFCLPGGLAKAGEVLGTDIQKDKEGTRIMKKLSKPRNPTKADKRKRYTRHEDPTDFLKLDIYNIDDVRSQDVISYQIPDLTPIEERVWLMDQRCNARGVHIDIESVEKAITIYEAAADRYNAEIRYWTQGAVESSSKATDLKNWCASNGCPIPDLQDDTITDYLKRVQMPQPVERVLQLRQLLGLASVKKLYAMRNLSDTDNRIRGIFSYWKAATGRWASTDLQLQNFTSGGPDVSKCERCGSVHWSGRLCDCGYPHSKKTEWGIEGAEAALNDIRTGSLDIVESRWGNAVLCISGCLRSMITAGPGNEFICSDYNAIEARGLAWLAGEEWRLDVFRDHGKIYEMSASRITGTPFEKMMQYKKEMEQHHPDRKKGKVAELALGYQGWIGAMLAFGADSFLTESEMRNLIIQWRDDSPAIVELWGGQYRGKPWAVDEYCYFGLEGAAIQAILNPGQIYRVGALAFGVKNDVLYMQLPSGRLIPHHRPRVTQYEDRWNNSVLKISYEGVNGNPKRGPQGKWMRIDTYGGSLTETAVQGMCRDWHAFAMLRLEDRGYLPALHVHDEPVAEVPKGFGSVDEMEQIMMSSQSWAGDLPIRASGGWRGMRFRKD